MPSEPGRFACRDYGSKHEKQLHPLNAERRTPNAERRTPNAERRTPNAERRTPRLRRSHKEGRSLSS